MLPTPSSYTYQKSTARKCGAFFCVELEKKGRLSEPSASERAEGRGAEYYVFEIPFENTKFSLASDSLQPHKKALPQGSAFHVELEKKGRLSEPSASERAEGRGAEYYVFEIPFENTKFSLASDSLQPHKKALPQGSAFHVELEGVEPSSKQVTDVLSTCLFRD